MHMQSVIQLKRSSAVRLATAMLIITTAFTIAAVGAGTAKAAPAKLNDGVLTITGTNGSNDIALRLKSAHRGILQVDLGDDGRANFSFKRKRIRKIVVNARGGADVARIDEVNGVFTDTIPTKINGEDGGDTLLGGSGAETLRGGNGTDSLDGNVGSDRAVLGAGNDVFVWDPGDGSDVVEGQGGADTMRFNGADVAEQVELSANGSRLKFFRTQGAITMDTAGIERVDFNALGGADLVTVNDLTGTDVDAVNVDLAGTLGGVTGDGTADSVVVNATNGVDTVDVSGDATGVAVSGLLARTAITHQEATDVLTVNGRDGNDDISGTNLAAAAISTTLAGDDGEDALTGSPGIETTRGGNGSDSLDGNGGNDQAVLGAGDDVFVWDPGDGSDVVEGQGGADTMRFNGADVAEQVELSPNGTRLKFFRTQGAITMDTAGVERVEFNALGGADLVTVNDLTATDVDAVNIELAGALGGITGDGEADNVVVNATNGVDTIFVEGDADSLKVIGLAAAVQILRSESANDRLDINTLAGNDRVDADGLEIGAIKLFVDGLLVP
jgi:hypothetical protein